MNRHRALSLTLLALGLWTSGTGCTSAGRRLTTATPDTADAPLVYTIRGTFGDGDPVLVSGNPNPLCVPRYVVLDRLGGARSDRFMIEFVFVYASKEQDRDRLAITIAAYDSHENLLVTETQQTVDHRSRTGPVEYLPAAVVGSTANAVQVTANGSIRDVAQVVIKVAPY